MEVHLRSHRAFQILLLGVLLFCTGTVRAQACDPTPLVAGVGLTDLNRIPVFSISANTSYYIKVCARAAAVCVDLTGGGQFVGGLNPLRACTDVSFPSPYTEGDVGTAFFRVQPSGPGIPLTGKVTPWDACAGEQPQASVNFTLPGTSCEASSRTYICGYALPGYRCDNGRNHVTIQIGSMAAAIPACRAAQPVQLPRYTDFCYVRPADGANSSDSTQCAAAGGSWRPGNSCCNFMGTKSCPR